MTISFRAKTKVIKLVILLACAPLVAAQVHVGVAGGVPFNDFILDTASGSRTGFSRVTSAPRRYTVGPVAEFRLMGPLGLHAGALYKRFGFDAVTSAGAVPGISSTTTIFSTTGNSWEFPVLARLRLKLLKGMDGYVEAGPSFRHLSGIRERGERTVRTLFPTTATTTETYETGDPIGMNRRTSFGAVMGGGVQFHLGRLRFAPGFRLTRWDTERTSSVSAPSRLGRTQTEALLAVTYDVAGRPEAEAARVPCCLEPGLLAAVPLLPATTGNTLPLPETRLDAPTRRFAAGALLEWRFHPRLSVEGSFLVRRFGRTVTGTSPFYTYRDSLSGYAWEAPLMVKWRAARIGPATLVAGGGPALRRASNIDWVIGDSRVDGSWLARSAAGLAVSGGVEFEAGAARVRPELRYSWFERPLFDFAGTARARQHSLYFVLGLSWAGR